MTRCLTVDQLLALHQAVIADTGGATGIRDRGGLESAAAQPMATFDGIELHVNLPAKAAALAVSLALNHPFVDGNKRVAHAAMEVFLVMNGFEIKASVDAQEQLMLEVAAGNRTREELTVWLEQHVHRLS